MSKIRNLLISLGLLLCSLVVFAAPININVADAEALATALNGIGAAKAQAIVDYRTENGPFKSIDDLAKIKGIGKSIIEKNRENIILEDEDNN